MLTPEEHRYYLHVFASPAVSKLVMESEVSEDDSAILMSQTWNL